MTELTAYYLSRSAWGARAPEQGPGPLDPDQVEGVAFHWPGTESHTPITSAAAVASALRGWQAYHMDDKGWSDIAYQVAIDQAGRAWTLRGLRTQSAANGNQDVNERFGAILLVLVQGEEPSDAMKATARAVVADFRRLYPDGDQVKGHKDVRPEGTDCPGPAAYAALERGEFTPPGAPTGDTPTPPTEDDDMWNTAEAEKIEKRYVLAHQLWLSQTAAEQAVSNALAGKLLAEGKTPAQAILEIEQIWLPVQRIQADALAKL